MRRVPERIPCWICFSSVAASCCSVCSSPTNASAIGCNGNVESIPSSQSAPGLRSRAGQSAPLDVDLPRASEVALEIGLLLAVHLALALAVAMTLAAVGIV
jgi:hypothetical protein